MGYHRAGFEIVGVDIAPQPRYPFEFVQADALEYVAAHGREFDAIHASPPCQGYSLLAHAPNRAASAAKYPKLVSRVRNELVEVGRPWVIENVPGAGLENPLTLCGTMFGLRTHKHRCFEMSHPLYFVPGNCNRARVIKSPGSGKRLAQYFDATSPMVTVAGHLFSLDAGRAAMGVDWMTRAELAEAIPPAYTEYIGRHLLAAIASGRTQPPETAGGEF